MLTDVPPLPPLAITGGNAMARTAKPTPAFIENVSYTPARLVIVPAADRAAPSVALGPATTITSGDRYWMTGWFSGRRANARSWAYVVNWGGAGDSTTASASDQGAIAESHRYLTAGTFTVTLEVTDEDVAMTGTASTTVTVLRMPVRLDVLPGDDANAVDLNDASREVPMALLSSATFDPRLVDLATVRVGNASIAKSGDGGYTSSLEDVNGDGIPDLVVRFNVGDLTSVGSLSHSSTSLTLVATLTDGRQITGTDVIQPVTPPMDRP